jgi:transmembrane sensor
MNNAERIGKLIFLYTRRELSKKEQIELEAWRNHSAINERTFQEAIDPEKLRADLKALEASRISRLEKTSMASAASKPSSRSVVRRLGIRIIKVAASVVFLFSTFMGFTIYRFVTAHKHPAQDTEDQLAAVIDFSDLLNNTSFNRGFLAGFAAVDIREGTNGWLTGNVPDTTKRAKDVYFRLFTSDGNRLLLNFSDSTHIWLNSNATIKYPSWQRTDSIRIFLSGEAYVHIPSGTKHIYEVKISPPVDSTTPSAFREAVADKISRSIYMHSSGGDFYLKANFGTDATMATLISGSLRIDSVAGKSVAPINLEAGQQAKLDSGNFQILKPEHISDLWSWKNP